MQSIADSSRAPYRGEESTVQERGEHHTGERRAPHRREDNPDKDNPDLIDIRVLHVVAASAIGIDLQSLLQLLQCLGHRSQGIESESPIKGPDQGEPLKGPDQGYRIRRSDQGTLSRTSSPATACQTPALPKTGHRTKVPDQIKVPFEGAISRTQTVICYASSRRQAALQPHLTSTLIGPQQNSDELRPHSIPAASLKRSLAFS